MSLELRAVSKRVGAETHIHETTLTLAAEGFNVLLGATGAGKTTLIKLMAGLEAPTAGEVWFRGRNVTGVIPRKRNVSLVHQFFINYPTMTVYENIASPLRVAGVAGVSAAVEVVSLELDVVEVVLVVVLAVLSPPPQAVTSRAAEPMAAAAPRARLCI